MVQCLFKTLPDEPGIHEKKIVWRRIPLLAKLRIACESRCAGLMFCFLLCITETYFETRLHHQKTYFWNSSSSSKYHSSRYGFELISFTVQFDEQESSTFEVSWNIFLACSSSCFPCLKSTSNNRVRVHFNILEWNAEIQIADRRPSRTNGRMTVTAGIETMLALCVQMTVWCFSVL